MKIKVSEPELLFNLHFLNDSNKRILFSGKYGSGKTYFLKEYLVVA
jgi:type IV secretory pathway ATPase VirB11/archaellum biosynthesis ATPase